MKGYIMFSVNHFSNTPENLFARYIQLFMIYKEEANNEQNCGVKQEYNSMNYNARMRTISKQLLNTLWGTFGKQCSKPQTKICDQYRE
ncbi:hypothetical protein B4U80_10187 [Leptotrombidium deliense]|uniref:DNA-directed DNA polymerase n=1 Tax=Leptotrombidium deliense TaxID=299467 RepID=A0A443RX42_9ACAR|nr:hypothetical protein B4U80_10187 [Leptotrombidium deliense]